MKTKIVGFGEALSLAANLPIIMMDNKVGLDRPHGN
jgi:hypothetical protein